MIRGRNPRSYWGAVLDAPDPHALGAFYVEILGWQVHKREPDGITLEAPGGVGYLAIQRERGYVAPVWPAVAGTQQMMAHLDVEVEDLELAVADALELGATLAEHQPQDDLRVLLDPAGHPFCLYLG